ncbi:hypothetical protein [Vibrio parahaemolyticus]|uniref:hypothetical protein n=1 Tax=Vibrio parahaemolyticus TaxID=670 RepID=UPI0015DD7176|nr:hypothetical protein [Vibrio parahaemolyticus]
MYINNYLLELKNKIEELDDIKKAYVFSGEHNRNAPNVTMDCICRFGVYVIARKSRDTLGYSFKAQSIAQDLQSKIKRDYSKPTPGLRGKPQLLTFGELSTDSDVDFSIWFFTYEQAIDLTT